MNRFLTFVALALASPSLPAEIHSSVVEYSAGAKDERQLRGQLYWDDRYTAPMPGVIIVHEWWGLNDYIKIRAEQLARQGYVVLAADMYGDGKQAAHPKQAGEWSSAVRGDAKLARELFSAAMQTLSGHERVADDKLSAIGYCFGGSIVLEMAIQGLALKGVASFHGGVSGLSAVKADIKPALRVFHGEADGFISDESLGDFQAAMKEHAKDYQFHSYPGAVHAFTNPKADELAKSHKIQGLGYNRFADSDSWARLLLFLAESYK